MLEEETSPTFWKSRKIYSDTEPRESPFTPDPTSVISDTRMLWLYLK
jgi:hypothetical protein